jgi:hypothetical protein
MPDGATFDSFQRELARLVDIFGRNLTAYKNAAYDEASLRQEFLNPLFRALGWDMENKAGLIPQHREVETESRTQIGGRQKRADYLFRTHPTARFICEAKKPAEEVHATYAFQAKRYAWNKGLALAVLTDFEQMKVFIVGGKPFKDEPDIGLWKTWHLLQYPLVAQELWNLLSRERVAAGSIDQLIESLPKCPTGKGKGKQGWLFKPDRSRALDTEFLNFLDEARRELASDLLKQNDRADLLEGTQLNEAVQRILDRILFLRICEDRDIDTGRPLDRLVRSWRDDDDPAAARRGRQQPLELHEEPPAHDGGSGLRAPKGTLWHTLVRHFRALDRRPPSHIPFFNGNLFKPHFSEELVVSDDWLAHFLDELGDEESPYLFSYIPVEILGTIYERFLGKVVRPHGRGVTIEEKPEVRKAGGVYYTPRYIVEYIVGQTVGKLLAGRKPEDALKLRILDPACGSGSFLIHAFEVVSEHCQQWLTDHPDQRKKGWCWLEENAVHLTTKAKRRILRETIHGVDLDPQAVEVTQLSLYLKMLENENRATLAHERDLFGAGEALLPPLEHNIKCGNSLIASDFSLMPDDLVRVHAFDWPVQFPAIMKAGGFDAVIGNPPYRMLQPHNTEEQELDYLKAHYLAAEFKIELFHLFLQRGVSLLKKDGFHGHIVPTTLLNNVYAESLRRWLMERCAIQHISVAQGRVFEDADVHTSVMIFKAESNPKARAAHDVLTTASLSAEFAAAPLGFSRTKQARFSALPGATWNILLNEDNAPLLQRLTSECVPLEKVARINRGLITGDRENYFSPRKLTAKHRPVLAGADVHRYATNPPSEFVRFERPRTSGGCWDADVHLAPHKIVIRQIGVTPTASVITEPIAVTGNIFTARGSSLTEEKFLLAVINSRLTAYFWRIMFADFKTSFPQVTIFSLSQVPVWKVDVAKPSDRARQDRLVGLVDKMLALTPKLRAATADAERQALQNAVTATDQQIDALVYELYGLTEEEIALVEGTR